MTPRDRQVIGGRIGALRLHATGKTTTRAAREAQTRTLETQVDPDGVLDPDERRRRVEMLRRAHMLELALKSAAVRRVRKAG